MRFISFWSFLPIFLVVGKNRLTCIVMILSMIAYNFHIVERMFTLKLHKILTKTTFGANEPARAHTK